MRTGSSLEEKQRWMRERHAPEESVANLRDKGLFCFERHFTPKQLGELWGLDESTVRRMFQDEPGVLKIGNANRRDGKRDYVSLRIPESVAARVHRERSG
jgi:hypothetical protein